MNLAEVVERAEAGNKHAIAQLIGVFEDTRASAPAQRSQVLGLLSHRAQGAVIGLTGTPGAGKSSLLARVVPQLLAEQADLTVAVLAIDPSSQASRGALLGDRTRTRFGSDPRAYFRSQATASELGGLAPTTYQVTRLLLRLFDVVVVETVGIGQSELDVRYLADHVYLVLQPLGGDEIQFLKAGIIEIPDSFVLNKCDDPAARMSYYQLRSALSLARPFDVELPPILRTSARTGQGVAEFGTHIRTVLGTPRRHTDDQRAGYFFDRWIYVEWGAVGHRFAATIPGGPEGILTRAGGSFDTAQSWFEERIVTWLAQRRLVVTGRVGHPTS